MPSIEENRRYWDEIYSWSQAGEEWSAGWGGTEALWQASLQPRLARFLPAATILELGPGQGRFTPYLMQQCQRYIGVDLSPGCIAICRQRFPQAELHANDGATLPMVKSASVDFVFSFFSLIHAEVETVESYLREIARILKPQGGAFLHHSNLAQHGAYFARLERLPKPLQRLLFGVGAVDLPQWRASSVSAEIFARCAARAGLACLCQETVNFGSRRTIDAFSSLVRADGPWQAEAAVWRNPGLMREAMRVRLRPAGRRPSPIPLSPSYYGPLTPRR
jgi:SAM-dependent methyltransferase